MFLIMSILFRFLLVIAKHTMGKSRIELSEAESPLAAREDSHRGIVKAFECLEQSRQTFKYDRRLTGSSSMDAALQEVRILFIQQRHITK